MMIEMTRAQHQALVERFRHEHEFAHSDGSGPITDPEFAAELAELFVDLLADTAPYGISGRMGLVVHELLLAAGQRASVLDALRVRAEAEADAVSAAA